MRFGWIFLLVLGFFVRLAGAGEPLSWVCDPQGPGGGMEGGPGWVRWLPGDRETVYARLDYRVTPPGGAEGMGLGVTFCFDEPAGGGGFLRVFWHGAEGGVQLAGNLLEGTGGAGQRTLVVPWSLLEGGGVLTVQSSEGRMNVWRVRWRWLETQEALAPAGLEPGRAPRVVGPEGGLTDAEVNGAPLPEEVDRAEGEVFSAVLAGEVERVEAGGVELVARLGGAPRFARLRLEVAGLAPGGRLEAVVNGGEAGVVAVETPEPGDPGWRWRDGGMEFAGWRRGTLFVGPGALREGENVILLRAGAEEGRVAMRRVRLELRGGAVVVEGTEGEGTAALPAEMIGELPAGLRLFAP